MHSGFLDLLVTSMIGSCVCACVSCDGHVTVVLFPLYCNFIFSDMKRLIRLQQTVSVSGGNSYSTGYAEMQ